MLIQSKTTLTKIESDFKMATCIISAGLKETANHLEHIYTEAGDNTLNGLAQLVERAAASLASSPNYPASLVDVLNQAVAGIQKAASHVDDAVCALGEVQLLS